MSSKKVTDASKVDVDQYAQDILNSWDQGTLMEFALEHLVQNIKSTPVKQLVEEHNEFYE